MAAIEGVYVAAITPRRPANGEIDLGATLDLIDFLGSSKVQGIVLFGSTGEFLHFEIEERQRLIPLAVKRSRVPVIVNVSHSTLDGSVRLALAARRAGAEAVLLMPPYFFRYEQEEIKHFYRAFSQELDGSIPILLYNIPEFTNPLSVETAVELLLSGAFAGIKDSSGRFEDFRRIQSCTCGRGLSYLVGNDLIFPEARAEGASGVVSGVACAAPELMLALDRAVAASDSRKERLAQRLQEFLSWIDSFPTPVGVKEAVALRGIKTGPHATPPSPAMQKKLSEFRDWFPGWLAEVKKDAAF